jgi:hypothetical protein
MGFCSEVVQTGVDTRRAIEGPADHARQVKGNKALKARSSTAQGGGREAAVTLGGHWKKCKPCKGDAACIAIRRA